MSLSLIADIAALTAANERLERECDWLATHLANALINPALIDHLHKLSDGLCHPPTPKMLREAATKEAYEKFINNLMEGK